MKRRLVVLTEIIAPYRIPVFNSLAKQADIDLHVIFLAETDTSTRQWRVYADEIRFSYEVLPSWRKRLGKYNILVNWQVQEALRRVKPDVILCGGYNYLASWQALRWASRNAAPFLLWCESTGNDHRRGHLLLELMKQNFLRNCDGFVVPGVSALAYVQSLGPARKDAFVAPNAVDIQLFASKSKAANERASRLRGELGLPARYFLFVGSLVKRKGVFDLLDAYQRLSPELRSQIGLVFAGDGPERAELESFARSIFPGSVYFPGFIQRDQLAGYYGLAECLVLPTHSDPWGLVVNEAMACGLPVICTDVAGCAADLVKSNGRLVTKEDTANLADAMKEIACDPSLREQMSRESSELIQNYSPELCAAGIAQAALGIEAGNV
jgi:glycosyltransferase involved in cell wall biosynthesis